MSILMRRRRALIDGGGFQISDLFAGGLYNGFYYDFTVNPTGAAIASITSQPPPTTVASQGNLGQRPTWNAGGYANFDGIDDNLSMAFTPGTEMTVVACFKAAGSTQSICGASSDAGTKRSPSLSINLEGNLGCGWMGQTSSIITDGVAAAGINLVAAFRGSATTAQLFRNGALKYNQPASGSPNVAFPMLLGAANASGTPAQFLNGRIHKIAIVTRYLPDDLMLRAQRWAGSGIVNF